MTLYTQPRDEIFASAAPPSEIQPFEAWLRGLGIAFDETNGFPEVTGINGLFNALNLYIKYLEQNGFAEWRSTLEYPVGAGVRVGMVWYRARTQNTNKPPATSQTDWELFLNATALTYQEPLYLVGNEIRIRDALTTVKGAVQFANATEIGSKSNVSKVVNPANVATIAQSTDVGMGQTWRNVGSQRTDGSTYTNITGRTITVFFGGGRSGGIFSEFYLNGQLLTQWGGTESDEVYFSLPIPPGNTYGYRNQPNFSYTFWELS